MFLSILYGGQNTVDCDPDDLELNSDNIQNDRIISVALDLVYGVSSGKMWTPKHVGLGCTLHQATRSKQLVQLFHHVGHTISYRNILQLDKHMEEHKKLSLERNN